jgi:hypothetical protein
VAEHGDHIGQVPVDLVTEPGQVPKGVQVAAQPPPGIQGSQRYQQQGPGAIPDGHRQGLVGKPSVSTSAVLRCKPQPGRQPVAVMG